MSKTIDLAAIAAQETAAQRAVRCRVLCCTSTACVSSGALASHDAIAESLKQAGLEKEVEIVSTGCMGLCSQGPIARVEEHNEKSTLYSDLDPASARQIAQQHLVGGQPITDHQISEEIPFFKRQLKIVLENAGEIDPERIEHYIARGGYKGLEKALSEMTPEQVCQEILQSGLRGRGGAGYPTGLKWDLLRKAESPIKFVVANGDEGDPGAYMDRTIMETDPHRILEGMAIAGYAVGASQGYLYVRAEYPMAVKRLEGAIRSARQKGLIGKGILGFRFDFDLDVRIGAGAFVCGEETALIASLEGLRGTPRVRPPYPTQTGLWSQPTMINNVETIANVAPIITKGGAWFASIGTEKSKGTKVFALTGKIRNSGLIEVPMGTTLRDILEEIGGGSGSEKNIKAIQTGGPSGGCIPARHFDTPVDYESLVALGSIMGSGGMIVMDDETNMVEIARFFMEFCMDESCGKCIPCRAGTQQMHGILSKICQGEATENDLEILKELCDLVQNTSLCGLGQTAPNPVLSTLQYFPEDYNALIKSSPALPPNNNPPTTITG